jgi:hypothetical protein
MLIQKAAIYLYPKIKTYQIPEVNEVLESEEYPIDYPITDTNISAFGFGCSRIDSTPELQQRNLEMISTIWTYNPDLNRQDNFGRSPMHLACTS